MAEERSAESETPWWRTIPSMLTAAAAFLGSLAAVLALFVAPGGGDEGSDGEARPLPAASTSVVQSTLTTSTTTETPPVSSTNEVAGEGDVGRLLTMVPASVRDSCNPDPVQNEELARVMCEFGGATLYYALYANDLNALHWFEIGVSNQKRAAEGRARSCGEVRTDRPFVGTWKRSGQSVAAGRRLCYYQFEIARIDWTETGQPILGEMLYTVFGSTRETSVDGALMVWNRLMG